MAEKTRGEELKEKLFLSQKNAYEIKDASYVDKAYAYCEDYKAFLDKCKTERESVAFAVEYLEKKFSDIYNV